MPCDLTNRAWSAKIGQLLRCVQHTIQRLKQTKRKLNAVLLAAAPGGGPGDQTGQTAGGGSSPQTKPNCNKRGVVSYYFRM